MRFEWLFIGYLLMFQITLGEITLLPALGYLLMLFAMLRLQKFEPAFAKAKYVLFAAVPIGFALLALQVYKSLSGDAEPFTGYNYIYFAVRLSSELTEMLTMLFVYLGVRRIGVNTEIRSLEKHSSRNMAVMGVYFVLETVMTVLSFTLSVEAKATDIYHVAMLYPFAVGFIWRVLNLWMIITCYLGVAVDTGDKNKLPEPEKPSSPPPSRKNRKKHR